MERINWFHRLLIASVAIAAVTLSYELRPEGAQLSGSWAKPALYLGSVLVGIFLPAALVALLSRTSLGRHLLLGSAWIEGFWVVIVTDEFSNHLTSGLIEFTYAPSTLDCTAHAYFPHGIRAAILAHSTSNIVYVRGRDQQYVSTFGTALHGRPLKGVALGRFTQDFSWCVNEYVGWVHFFDGGNGARQLGRKITRRAAKALHKEHKEMWREEAIREHQRPLLARLHTDLTPDAPSRQSVANVISQQQKSAIT